MSNERKVLAYPAEAILPVDDVAEWLGVSPGVHDHTGVAP